MRHNPPVNKSLKEAVAYYSPSPNSTIPACADQLASPAADYEARSLTLCAGLRP